MISAPGVAICQDLWLLRGPGTQDATPASVVEGLGVAEVERQNSTSAMSSGVQWMLARTIPPRDAHAPRGSRSCPWHL